MLKSDKFNKNQHLGTVFPDWEWEGFGELLGWKLSIQSGNTAWEIKVSRFKETPILHKDVEACEYHHHNYN